MSKLFFTTEIETVDRRVGMRFFNPDLAMSDPSSEFTPQHFGREKGDAREVAFFSGRAYLTEACARIILSLHPLHRTGSSAGVVTQHFLINQSDRLFTSVSDANLDGRTYRFHSPNGYTGSLAILEEGQNFPLILHAPNQHEDIHYANIRRIRATMEQLKLLS